MKLAVFFPIDENMAYRILEATRISLGRFNCVCLFSALIELATLNNEKTELKTY